uniref:Protein kinase domain-containing protein n=1 Tax=viral metagenome TaxID=1070528 RepID=A0A6C0JXJ1_9ZZZZ
MEFTYIKPDHTVLFQSVIGVNGMGVKYPQNYIPIYNQFFSLTSNNYNTIRLNHKHSLYEVKNKVNANIFNCTIQTGKIQKEQDVYFKYSPLLDPLKYIVGRYKEYDIGSLPQYTRLQEHAKCSDSNNSAYIDGMFNYLSNQLLHYHGFLHGLEFYGSFLAIKNTFECNISDDIEYIVQSDFFNQHNDTLFHINIPITKSSPKRSRCNKPSLDIGEVTDISYDTMPSLNISDSIETELELVYLNVTQSTEETTINSECSSVSSKTEENNSDTSSTSGYSTITEDDDNIATLYSFPVHVIAMEKCVETLDDYLSHHKESLCEDEWRSILFQVVMTLLVYQRTFHLTHNDLHTNNIMYTHTHHTYLVYTWNDITFKVPTFGKIYKIIDFGRAIYRFRGRILCSDSFHPKGDAASQYNCEPYLNKQKPCIEPNFSFDLCRLGCSLFDFISDDIDYNTVKDTDNTHRIILEWCQDDKGRNILVKQNGEERYPDFKLYKMIARTVHTHTPELELNKPYFSTFITQEHVDTTLPTMHINAFTNYIN